MSHLEAREKLVSLGVAKLSEIELMSLILGSGTARAKVNQLANSVISSLNSHSELNLVETLRAIPGMGIAKTTRVVACLELGNRLFADRPITTIMQPQDTLPHLAFLQKKRTEHCLALYLSARHELLKIQTIAQGTLNAVSINPREVFAPALQLPCASIIVAHNHPSGDPQPSQEDALVTDHLKAASELLGIPLSDHIIVAKQGWFSFAQEGLL